MIGMWIAQSYRLLMREHTHLGAANSGPPLFPFKYFGIIFIEVDMSKSLENLVRETVKDSEEGRSVVSWLYKETIKKETGTEASLEEMEAVVKPYENHKKVLVEVQTSEYSNYEPYIIVSWRQLPPGISLG